MADYKKYEPKKEIQNLKIDPDTVSKVEPDMVKIVSLVDAVVKVTGTVTNRVYIFSGAGAVVEVDVYDADDILNKKRGRACCGGNSGKPLFRLDKEI